MSVQDRTHISQGLVSLSRPGTTFPAVVEAADFGSLGCQVGEIEFQTDRGRLSFNREIEFQTDPKVRVKPDGGSHCPLDFQPSSSPAVSRKSRLRLLDGNNRGFFLLLERLTGTREENEIQLEIVM